MSPNELVSVALFTASIIIAIGFVGNYLFKRTGIPDMLYLILLGILVGPVLGIFNPSSIMGLAPYIAALALVIILFDGGLRMNLHQVFTDTPISALLSILGFVFATVIVSIFTHYVMGIPLLYGVLFGTIFGGGGSSIAVLSVVMRAKISNKCETVLSLESIIDDILCVVGSLVVTNIIVTGHANSSVIFQQIATQFLLGGAIGMIFGVIWLNVLRRMKEEPYLYMLTLAVVFFAYSVSESLGGNGALASFLFGLVLGNEIEISNLLKLERTELVVGPGLKRFEEEIAFLIRSFFFVYLGLIAYNIDIISVFWGLLISLLLLVIRFGTVKLATFNSPLSSECDTMSIVLTRGLVAAILATIPMQMGLLYADLYLNIAVVVIMATVIITTAGIPLITQFKGSFPPNVFKNFRSQKTEQ